MHRAGDLGSKGPCYRGESSVISERACQSHKSKLLESGFVVKTNLSGGHVGSAGSLRGVSDRTNL